ncbi:MAG: FAD-dependent oxidoreductase [Synechococcaceae cyanobacterium]|nr:FAD-dependent oxidoreductase [Synechococcaceae cyanobacterium]
MSRSVIVVGAGLVGLASAWLLQRHGHAVLLLDSPGAGPASPSLPPPANQLAPAAARAEDGTSPHLSIRSGSAAALGLLMAQISQRDSGRAWRLRQRSLLLWREWRQELLQRGQSIPWRPGLLLLAATAEERSRQEQLARERQARGMALEFWDANRLRRLVPEPPGAALGAIHSPEDGQLDPGQAMAALRADGLAAGLRCCPSRVQELRAAAQGDGGRWRLRLEDGQRLESDWLVLAAGVASAELLHPLGLERPLQPLLGQALELELPEAVVWQDWPGVVSWKGLHIVPRPDRDGGRRLWLGATVEPGTEPAAAALAQLRHLAGDAPAWLAQASLRQHWVGVRARPRDRPAPLLEQPRPGLLLATGHNRNGVLLAPVSAEWVLSQVEEWVAPPGWAPAR